MKSHRSLHVLVGTACAVTAMLALHTDALALGIVSHEAYANPATSKVEFRIVFDGAPNFVLVDAFGRQADSFQIYLDPNPADPAGSIPANFTSLVRGEE